MLVALEVRWDQKKKKGQSGNFLEKVRKTFMVIKHVISMCLTLSLCTLLKALKNKPKSSFCKKKRIYKSGVDCRDVCEFSVLHHTIIIITLSRPTFFAVNPVDETIKRWSVLSKLNKIKLSL